MKQLTFFNAIFLMSLYLTVTDFTWYYLTVTIIFSPILTFIYERGMEEHNAKKLNQLTVNKFEDDISKGNI